MHLDTTTNSPAMAEQYIKGIARLPEHQTCSPYLQNRHMHHDKAIYEQPEPCTMCEIVHTSTVLRTRAACLDPIHNNPHEVAHLGSKQLRLASACDGRVPARPEPMCTSYKTLTVCNSLIQASCIGAAKTLCFRRLRLLPFGVLCQHCSVKKPAK